MRLTGGALAILLCSFAIAAQRGDYYQGDLLGKTRTQILQMGREKWLNFIEDKIGSLDRQKSNAADATFTDCVAWNNARLRKNIPIKTQKVLSDALYRFGLVAAETNEIERVSNPGNWHPSDDEWSRRERAELESKLLPMYRKGLRQPDITPESQKDLNRQCMTLASKLNDAFRDRSKDWLSNSDPKAQKTFLDHSKRMVHVVKLLLMGLAGLPLGLQRSIVRTAKDEMTSTYDLLSGK